MTSSVSNENDLWIAIIGESWNDRKGLLSNIRDFLLITKGYIAPIKYIVKRLEAENDRNEWLDDITLLFLIHNMSRTLLNEIADCDLFKEVSTIIDNNKSLDILSDKTISFLCSLEHSDKSDNCDLTGNDSFHARHLYSDETSDIEPEFKLMLACNNQPRIPSTIHGQERIFLQESNWNNIDRFQF